MSAICPNRCTATSAENLPRAASRDFGSIVRKLRVDIDENRPMAGGDDGADQRRIRKQRERDARSRLQFERARAAAQRLPAAARPELRAVAEQAEASRRRGAAEDRRQARPRNPRACRAARSGEWSASGKSAWSHSRPDERAPSRTVSSVSSCWYSRRKRRATRTAARAAGRFSTALSAG